MSAPAVITERPAEGVGLIRINRPDARNALNMEVRKLIGQHLTEMADDESIRCIVLTGNDKAFAAGADIKEMANAGAIEMLLRGTQKLWRIIYGCPKPVIAAVSGFALGGGCELAMACHVRIASEKAKLGQPEAKLGIVPGYGGTQRLPRLIGRGAALRLLLTGDMIDAAEAHRLGLVDQVTTPEALITTVRALLTTMLANAPLAIAGCIEAVNRGQDVPLEEGCTIESDFFGLLSSTADMKEGMRAFLEKRPPQFTGR
jgi:enoyl-CoA hydratase